MPNLSHPPAGQTVYLNGRMLAAADARLPVDDHGVLYGLGFFETFRTSGGRPHHWVYHRRRLEQACARVGLILPAAFLAHDETRLTDVVRLLLKESGLAEGVFRYTITAGAAAAVYDRPTELLTVRPLPAAPRAEGICLRVLNLARDTGEWLPRPKSLSYVNALLGARELQRRTSEPSDDGLFLSREGGFVVETTRQNLAWIADGELRYPEPTLGPVAGTCLQWLLGLGPSAKPCRVRLEELAAADAIMTLNAVRGVTPVRVLWDAQDRAELCAIDSHRHPMVASFRRQWDEELATTTRA